MDVKRPDRVYTEARVAVLGSLLLAPEIAGEVMQQLRPEDFGAGELRSLYDACRRLFADMRPIDAVTLAAEAGEPYVASIGKILELTPTAANWREYAAIVRDEAQLRRLQAVASEILAAPGLEAARKGAEQLAMNLAGRSDLRIVSLQQGLVDFLDRQQSGKPPNYLKWHLGALDNFVYAEPGDFIIIGGYPSSGKTMLATQLALGMATEHRIGIYSLETRDRKLFDRIVSQGAKVPYGDIKRHGLTPAHIGDVVSLGTAAQGRMHLDIIDATGLSVADVQATALARHYDVVFIDYLQLLQAPGEKRFDQVTNISLALRRMAASTGITVIGLAQLSRAEKGRKNPSPSMSDLRESGQLEQDADLVLLLYLDDNDMPDGDRLLKVAKSKEGERGFLRLGFYPKHMSFYAKGGKYDQQRPRPSRLKPVTPEEQQMELPF